MKILEAVEKLKASNVPDYLYSIEGLGGGEIWCIEKIGKEWAVYFSERGQKKNMRIFHAEDDAVDYWMNKTKKIVNEFTGKTLDF